jgi:DNA-binding transcriptional ArsR family regulator
MDDLSAVLLDRLIEKTFESMSQEEKLSFVEKLFVEMKPESQERFLLRLAQQLGGGKPDGRSTVMRLEICDEDLQDIGPWRMCCRMMANIDRADELETLDTAGSTRLFHALADETRIKIVKILTDGEKRVDDLTQVLDSAQSTVSHHLRILKDAGLIHGDKRGRSNYYSLVHPVQIITRQP